MKSTVNNYLQRLTITLMSVLCSVGVWAQSELIYARFTATDGMQETGNENEGYQKLVDGKYMEGNFTKWKTLSTAFPSGEGTDVAYHYVDFHADAPIPVSKYILTTGDDNASNPGRNPKSWILKAKQNENDQWTTIAEVNNDTRLQDVNYTDYEYAVSTPGAYQYFRFMVSELKGEYSQYLQLGELRFKGTYDPTDMAYTSIAGVKQLYLYSGNDINVSCIVKTHYGIGLTMGTDYTVSITKDGSPVTTVKDKGTYTLTLTGKGNYHGTRSISFEVSDQKVIGVAALIGSFNVPVYTFNHYSLSQQIYTHEEIGEPGYIHSISFYNRNGAPTRSLDIYMASTSKSSFSSKTDWVAVGATNKVFNGNVTFANNGWTTIELTTPFLYDGQNNLLLVVNDNTGEDAERSSDFNVYSAAGQALCINQYYAADMPDPTAPGSKEGELLEVKNQIVLGITPTNEVFLPIPTGLTCTALTATTATLQWTETGSATAWQICLDEDEDNLISTTENPFTLSNLTEDHSYTARVRAIDGSGHRSSWSDLTSFTPTDKTRLGSGNAADDMLPLSTYSYNSLTQQIYTVPELGKAAAFISIDYYCSQDVDHVQDMDIYMVHTDKSSFSSQTDWIAVTDADRVYHGEVTLTKGWNTIVLDNRFDYDGDSNVAIMVDTHHNGSQSGPVFLVYNAPSQAISYVSNTYNFDPKSPLTEPSSANGILNCKNQMRILKIDPVVCTKPTALACSSVTAHTATLSWTSDASAWQVCINGDEANVISVTQNTYTLSGLNAETAFTVKVRTVCSPNDMSAWSREVSFTTAEACPALTEMSVTALAEHSATLNWPDESEQYNVRYRRQTGTTTLFSQSFTSGVPSSWTTIDNDGDGYNWQSLNSFASQYDYPWLNNQAKGVCSPSYVNNTPLETDNWLVSPQLTLDGMLRISTRCLSSGNLGFSENCDLYEVLVSTTGTATTDFTVVQQLSPAPIGIWDEACIDISPFGGQKGYIAIRHHCSDKFLLVIGDVRITEDVYTDWTTHNGITTNSLDITNLNSKSTYQWEVQKVCGGIDGSSKWASDFFTTDYAELTPIELAASNITPTSVSLSWKGVADVWKLYVDDGAIHYINIRIDEVTIDGNNVRYTLNGLKHSTLHSVRVCAYGDNNSFTEWSNFAFFTTLEVNPVPTGMAVTPTATTATISWTGYGDSYNVRYKYVDQDGGNVMLSEGFENGLGNWTRYDCHDDSKINDSDSNSGSYAFQFDQNSGSQYLISPELPGGADGGTFEFYYRFTDHSWNNNIQIGFSTTTNDRKAFSFTYSLGSGNDQAWHKFSGTIPNGAKYFCIKKSSSLYAFYVDDFLVTSNWIDNTANKPSATITGLSPATTYQYQVQSVKDGESSNWTDAATFTTCNLYDLVLADHSTDNSTVIGNTDGEYATVTLSDRTLYTDGDWNTLCLPFNLELKGSPLEGFTVKELDTKNKWSMVNGQWTISENGHATGLDNGTLYLNFKNATSIEAGKPYIVKKLDAALDVNTTPTFTATSGTTEGSAYNQHFSHFVDGNTSTYWRALFTNGVCFCEFNAAKPIQVTGYKMTTGNQVNTTYPTVWTIKAKLRETDQWTTIDSRNANTSGDALPSTPTTTKEYTIAADKQGAYQYFLFEATQSGGTSVCLSELTMLQYYIDEPKNIVSPAFTDVIINGAAPTPVTFTGGKFVGTYDYKQYNAETPSILFLGGNNTLYYPQPDLTDASNPVYPSIGAFRAYFDLGSNTARAFRLNFGDGSGSAGVSPAFVADGDVHTPSWYTVNGVKLYGKPTKTGLYIHGNRKVVVK